MNVPFDLEPSHQPARNPAARWLLFLILGGMIALSLYGYLQRDGTASADYVAIDTQLKMAHKVHQMQLSVGGGTNTKLDFSTPLSEIDKIKKGDPIASRFSIIARHEAKKPLDPKDFLEVEKSPTPRSKATKWIYGTRPISKADLPLIDKSFPDNLFTDRLARIHAHEKAGDSPAFFVELGFDELAAVTACWSRPCTTRKRFVQPKASLTRSRTENPNLISSISPRS